MTDSTLPPLRQEPTIADCAALWDAWAPTVGWPAWEAPVEPQLHKLWIAAVRAGAQWAQDQPQPSPLAEPPEMRRKHSPLGHFTVPDPAPLSGRSSREYRTAARGPYRKPGGPV